MGLFGGGGGGDSSQAINAVNQSTQQGISALEKYYQPGVNAINQGAAEGQSYLAPYSVGGGNAYDAYMDALGVARPEAGSYQLQSALAANSNKNYGGTAASSDLSLAEFGPHSNPGLAAQGWVTNGTYSFNTKTGAMRETKSGGGAVDPNSVGLKTSYDQTTHSYTIKPQQAAVAGIGGTDAQTSLAEQYRNGQLAMTAPNSQSVLEKLRASPGYQFTLNQGLEGVDRSAAAKGLLGSGSAIKQATGYATGLSDQNYQQYVDNLKTAAGFGAAGSAAQAGVATQKGGQIASLGNNQGANQASLYGQQGSALSQIYAGQAAANAQTTSSLFGLAGSVLGGLF